MSFLLLYCSFAPSSTKYFLMLEDDIATKPGFDAKVLNYLHTHKNRPDFFHAQFTYLGLIGKLFPIETILVFSKFLLHFLSRIHSHSAKRSDRKPTEKAKEGERLGSPCR